MGYREFGSVVLATANPSWDEGRRCDSQRAETTPSQTLPNVNLDDRKICFEYINNDYTVRMRT